MTQLSEHVAKEINRVLEAHPEALGGDVRLPDALKEIEAMDRAFEKRGGSFFHIGGDAFETAERFTKVHVDEYRDKGRPSLPALAVYHAERMKLDKNSPEYKALILVAVRAEMKTSAMPEYHSKFHFMDVSAMAANLLEKNGEMAAAGVPGTIPLTKEEKALTLLAAIGHDLEHEGRPNPPENPVYNEEKSFAVMGPLLKRVGVSGKDANKVRAILTATSPNGPLAVLKTMADAQRKGCDVDLSAINPLHNFPALKPALDNARVTQMAAIVTDADLYASSGAGMKSSLLMRKLFTVEMNKAGHNVDLNSDKSHQFFLDSIVGKEGYASVAARAAANESFQALRDEINRNLIGAGVSRKASRPSQRPGA